MNDSTQDAVELARQIRDGSLSVTELLESTIEKIEEKNPAINALTVKTYDWARETASVKPPSSPLSGIPILIKDLTAIKGVKTTSGSTLLKDNVSQFDAEIITQMKKAGMIILGKTNMPEFGLTCTTEPRLYGPTHNPWNHDYTSGGSSGGAAAAVASDMIQIAHGSDGGGSIRTPASFCGVFGLKPSRGRVPFSPSSGSAIVGISIHNCLTRSVRDSAAFLDIIGGYCPGEPYWEPPKTRPYLEEVEFESGKLRIALVAGLEDWTFRCDWGSIVEGDFHSDVEKVVRDSADLCTQLGHEVDEVKISDITGMGLQLLVDSFMNIWCTSVGSVLKRISERAGVPPQREWVEDLTWGLYLMSKGVSSVDYMQSHGVLEQLGRHFSRFMKDYDLILTATNPGLSFKLGEVNPTHEEPMKNFDKVAWLSSLTALSNASGNPAMSVPLGKGRNGLPVGTQFIGRFGDEALLFRMASQLEKAVPWNSL